MENKVKRGIFIVLFAALFLPLLQEQFGFIKSGPLNGYFKVAADDTFSCSKWFAGTYQEKKGRFINDHIGFREDLVRINNQLDYSLFDLLHSSWIAQGSENFLLQTIHVKSYYGADFAGYEPILNRAVKIKALQDTFAKQGKLLLLVHAPCKAFFQPESIPDRYKKEYSKGAANFETYRHIEDSLGIRNIDFNSWFLSMKGKEQLYTKQGIHWSIYGSLIAADSFARYLEQSMNACIPRPVWNKVERTSRARYSDDDLGLTLNLIWPVSKETFSYPIVSYTDGAQPRVIFLGDSFLEAWLSTGFIQHTSTDWQVWESFRTIIDKDHDKDHPREFAPADEWKNTLKSTDCLVIMYTSFNLPDLGSGFIEQAYSYYFSAK